ncbi:MAG: hypothetical protein A2Y97_13010 [Nitrospirae bacterium RBG_13_39_12]|nr:MAG: hypothetical protein A2Y97_13010 [Nitrospirae bacterium RBG_13_39_12]
MIELRIFANRLLKLLGFLFSLFFLLIVLKVNPMYANPEVEDNELDMIKKHVENVKHKYPQIDNKLLQVEEKLKTGKHLKDCCNECHMVK